MNNFYAVVMITFGTIIGSNSYEQLLNDVGDYRWDVGIVLAVFMFGIFSGVDLLWSFAKKSFIATREWLK